MKYHMLHYTTYRHATASDWVTFVHGAGGSSSIWYQQVRDFRQHFNVLLVDLRGHGQSSSARMSQPGLKRYSFDLICSEIMEVLDHLAIGRSHFVGISLGTILIRELAEKHPDRVQRLVMGGAVMKLNLRGQLLMRLGFLLRSMVPYLLLYRLFAFAIMPRRNHRRARNLFIREARKLYQKEFIRWFGLTSQINPLLAFFRLTESQIPTLYIMGEEDHMFLPAVRKLVGQHATAQLHVVPDCGHVVNVEQPAIFNKQVLGFLSRS
jgi:pimeloyl-ACP methyl ester carboxylesterase